MEMLNKYLPCKVVFLTSSLYNNILLWTSKLKNKPKEHLPHQAKNKGDLQVGLKTLIDPKQKQPPRIVHCCNMAPTLKASSLPQPMLNLPPLPRRSRLSSLWSSSPYVQQPTVMGDVIGTESGDCMMSEIEDYMEPNPEPERELPESSRTRRNLSARTTREFPPPITLLRGTGRMPWVLRRECSEDGRLIVTVFPQEDDEIEYCEECGYSMNEEEEVEEEEELRDLEFNEEPEDLEHVDDAEEEEEEEVIGFEFEEGLVAKEGPNLQCSVVDSPVNVGSQQNSIVDVGFQQNERRGSIPKCFSFTYNDGFVQGSDSLWKHRIGGRNGLMGRSGSAPLLQPMTTPVM